MHFFNNRSIADRIFGKSFFVKYYLLILGVILLTISAKVAIPFYPVPMTLQTLVVFLLASSSGMIGFYSTLAYVLLGIAGLPLFANGGGFGYIASPTFGFLYGMVFASLFLAYASKKLFKESILGISFSIIVAAIIIFLCGLTHLTMFIGFEKAITFGFLPFMYSEILKIFLAIMLTYVLLKKTKQKTRF